ncbi:carboxypeptidase A1-like [Brachionus plicatilis]|uniref:Carboxypeptidase A1-like n=1 Tax=Brachionus plicatilis TaxID=10195 RepID=A0A3M7RGR4_BRAPC|nr:carboxypeptidase A1-like [Brachionus plicatilis]
MSLQIATVLILISSSLCANEKFSFEGYKLIQITPKSVHHIQLLDSWENNPDFDVWNRIKSIEESVDVALSPKAFEHYKSLFKLASIPYTIINDNIQKLLDREQESMIRNVGSRSIVGKYARYTEVMSFISNMEIDNPDIASTYSFGKTFENRDLKVLVLKTSTSQKNVWIDCGIHSREWVSVSTCVWFIDRLIKDFRNSDPVATDLLNYYEFHILPIVNPDGYEYTHSTFRLWRKNRRPNSGSSCVGTDLNRNYGYKWMVAGASLNPCSDTYAGPSADSEVETKSVEKAINDRQGEWDTFVTIHSYGNFWMVPWGWGSTQIPDYSDLYSVSKIGVDALKSVYGTKYSIGSPANLLYSAAGGSFDWTYAVANIKYSIALELRPGRGEPDYNYGFVLPEDRAPAVGEETYVGLIAMIDAIRNLNRKN